MASLITSAGSASGMDFESIISATLEAKRAKLTKQTTTKKESANIELSGVGKLKGLLENFKKTLEALRKDNSFNTRKVTTNQPGDNPFFTVSPKDDASNCDYEVTVDQLATSERLSTDVPAKGVFHKGKLTITLPPPVDSEGNVLKDDKGDDMKDRVITIDVDEGDNLTQVRKKINDNDFGVTASIITNAQGAQRLTLDSGITGYSDKGAFKKIDFQADKLNDNERKELLKKRFPDKEERWYNNQLDNANGTGAALRYKTPKKIGKGSWTVTEGKDAKITVDGMQLTSKTNTFDNQISGMSLTVNRVSEETKTTTDGKEVTTKKPTRLTVDQDLDGITKKVSDFVGAYNAMMGSMDALYKHNTYQEGHNMHDGGELSGDGQLKSMQNAMRNMMTNFHLTSLGDGKNSGGKPLDIYSLGMKVDKDGRFSLDTAKFKEGIKENFNAVVSLFTKGADIEKPTADDLENSGLIVKLDNFIEDYTKANGLLSEREESINMRIRDCEDKEASNSVYLERFEESLRKKYAQLDVTISGYNTSFSYLQSVLG